MAYDVTCISASPSILGENPLYDAATGALYAIDCMSRQLQRRPAPDAPWETWALPRTPGSFALRARGGMLMAYRRGLAMIEPGTPMLEEVPTPQIDFGVAVFNDGKCDRRGRFWTGTMHRELSAPLGSLYRVDPDLSTHCMDGGITLSNGIGWSPDDRTLYYCDSRPGAVWAYDYDIADGRIANKRLFIDFADRPGHPDGCTVDAEGCFWVAEVGAWQVVRFDPAGRQMLAIKLPVSRVTSVAFGGPGFGTLFVTSMRHGLTEEEARQQPRAGCVFAVDAGVAGLPEPRFAG